MATRRSHRLIATVVLIAMSGILAGCASSSSFDPTDMFDMFDTKKKLPGNREPGFPGGVPGLEQGVPKELYKENVDRQQLQQQQQRKPHKADGKDQKAQGGNQPDGLHRKGGDAVHGKSQHLL